VTIDEQHANTVSNPLVRERLSVAWAYLVSGVTLGGWLSRVPTIKAQVGLSDAHWGTIAICSGLGALAAMLLARRFIDRTGAKPLLYGAVPVQLALAVINGFTSSTVALAAGLAAWGMTSGAMTSAINAQGVIVERHYGRVIMPSFHACWSGGTLLGALAGALCARLAVGPGTQFAVTGAVLLTGSVYAARFLPDDLIVKGKPEHSSFTRQIVLISAIAFCSQISEGAASQWSAIYVHEFLKATATTGAIAYGAYSLAMAVGRTAGSRVVERLGRVRTLTICTTIGPAGFAVGLLTDSVAGTIAGLVVLGLGLSCVIPTAFSLGSNQPGVSPGSGVTTIGLASWPASLIGPPLIGYLSAATSLRTSLLGVAAIAALIAVLSQRVRDISPAG
jgi:MFS family permease